MSQTTRHLMLLLFGLSLVVFQGHAEDAAPAARPAAPATAKDWPLFRGDPLSSGVAHTTLADKPEQLWKYTVKDGAFDSTAAIADGVVYIVATDLVKTTAENCGWTDYSELVRFPGSELEGTVFQHQGI